VLPVVDVAADAHAPQVVMPETQRYLPFRVPVDLYKIHDACS
jgi:hypothetical protein